MKAKAKAAPAARPLTVSVKGAAALLGVGRDAVYSLIEAGKLRTLALGQRTLVVYGDIPRYVEKNATRGLDPARQEKARAARKRHGNEPVAA